MHQAGEDLGGTPPVAANPDRCALVRTGESVPARDRRELLQRDDRGRTEIEPGAAEREVRVLHADAGEDAVHELVETDHLRDGLVDRDLAIAVLLGQQIEVTADHRQRRA